MKSVSYSIVTLLTLIYCPFPTNADQILRIRPENVFTNTTQLELVAALAETNLHRADTILKGLALEERGTNGATVLWWEANVGNFEAFDYLLGKGAKVG